MCQTLCSVAHNLKLVLNVASISIFFYVIQKLYMFFIKRWDILSSFTTVSNIKLKALHPTRWSSREECKRYRYVDVLKVLININLVPGLQENRFILFLCSQKYLKVLQKKILNIRYNIEVDLKTN